MAPDLSHGMHMQLSQRLEMVMTPQMIQSMEVLQLPMMALEQRIANELLENPALELMEMRDDGFGEAGEGGEGGESGEGGDGGEDVYEAEAADANDDLRKVDEIDYDWDSNYDESAPRRAPEDDDERFDPIENAATRQESLYEHLEGQLGVLQLEERKRRLATHLALSLDPAGYVPGKLEEMVDPQEDPPPSLEELEQALEVVQSLEPAGVGARDLKECLLLQIDATDPAEAGEDLAFVRALVERHLEDVAANRLPQIAKAERCDLEAVKHAVTVIKTLNPHPGLDFGSENVTAVRPDIHVELVEAETGELAEAERAIERRRLECEEAEYDNVGPDGDYALKLARGRVTDAETELELFVDKDTRWDVRLPSGQQPDISEMFLALFDTTKRGQQLREALERDPEKKEEFAQMQGLLGAGDQGKVLREKYQSARWLVTAIAQRERTLYRVTRQIVARQKDYLSGRVDAPQPLMMQDVADRLDIDISTVSRAVRDKYMATPLGLKPLRMFFTRAVGGAGRGGGKAKSNVQIMNRVKALIDAEDKSKPLKDDEIQGMLEGEGISIKRRTVAKYRSNLGYPNHSQRREY